VLAAVVIACMSQVSHAQDDSAGFKVRYRSADTIYLDAGRASGLAEGDRLEVVRDGKTIAEIEVIFVAEHSASCKILREAQAIQVDDGAIKPGDAAAALAVPPAAVAADAGSTESESKAPSTTSQPAGAGRTKRTRFVGSFSLDWESFTDDGPRGLDYDRTTASLNVRIRDIAGNPFTAVVRLRTLEYERARALGPQIPASQQRNRFYEASFSYNPPEGRFAFSVGRLGTSPFVGIGYLDGALGQVRLGNHVYLGAFGGRNPDIAEFGFEDRGSKYGAYARFRTSPPGQRRGVDVLVGGAREDGESAVSREYATLQVLYRSSGSWSVSQYAEVDVNRDWREELADSSAQVSLFSLNASGRLSRSSRLFVGYNLNRRFRTEETRFVPVELWDDLRRQGLQARLQFGRPGKLQASVHAGLRERQDDSDNTVYVGGGVYHPNVIARGLFVGGNLSVFSNPLTEGMLLSARIAKRFRAGHEVSLVLGGMGQDYQSIGESVSDYWLRIGGWVELPKRLFARGEVEINRGDDLEGQRLTLGAGYRF
jgi:hypothetical protein